MGLNLYQGEYTSLENQKSLGIRFCKQSGNESEVYTDFERYSQSYLIDVEVKKYMVFGFMIMTD